MSNLPLKQPRRKVSEKLKELTAEDIEKALADPEFKKKFDKSFEDFIKKQDEERRKPITMKSGCNCCRCIKEY